MAKKPKVTPRAAKKIAAPEKMRMPRRVAVEPIKIMWMTPEEWARVPANPYQKTNRAKRVNSAIEHLRKFVEEHATVRMGIYPDGRWCKIEGHTRDDIWQNRPWLVDRIPERLRVECFPVANDREAAERFKRVDNRKTAKNAADDVHGSFRLHGIPTDSTFFQNASNIKSALSYAFSVVVQSTSPEAVTVAEIKRSTIDDHVLMFRDALIALDAIDVNRAKLTAPFITAFLLAHMKHGNDIVPFFSKINEGTHGEKRGKKMCPIAAIELERERWKGGGRTEHMDLVVQVLGALDTYMKGAFKQPDYKPAVNMQKIMTVDLGQYLLRAKAKRTGRTLKDGEITR